jgi:hypothetical protein
VKQSSRADSLFEQLLAHVPPETVATFTTAQLNVLKQASSNLGWKKHTIDIRLSIPILVSRFYLVILAGPERRSCKRLHEERGKYPVWTFTNLIAISGFFGLLTLSVLGVSQILLPLLIKVESNEFHPTAVPGIYSKTECENTIRSWHDGKCWDDGNHPNF